MTDSTDRAATVRRAAMGARGAALAAAIVLGLLAWRRGADGSPRTAPPAPPARAAAPRALPPLGVAIPDSGTSWCASFDSAGVRVGAPVALVFPGGNTDRPAYRARVTRARPALCRTEFGAVVLGDSTRAYDLAVTAGAAPTPDGAVTVALVVDDTATWTRASDGAARADLDGDGAPEVARTCLVDEGRYFTLWSGGVPSGRRRWWAYVDLGALVDSTCTAADLGGGDSSGTGGAGAAR